MPLQVELLAEVIALASREDTDLYPIVHRHLGLVAELTSFQRSSTRSYSVEAIVPPNAIEISVT